MYSRYVKRREYAIGWEIIVELRVLGPAKFFSLGFSWKEPLKRFRGGAIKNHCSSRWMVRIPRFAPAFERPPNSYDGMRTIILVHLSSPSSFPSRVAFLTVRGWKLNSLAPSTINASLFNFKEREKKCYAFSKRRHFYRSPKWNELFLRKRESWWKLERKAECSKLWFEYLDASNRLYFREENI